MTKPKRKLTAAEKAEKRRRRREYMTIFINGKQKRVKRPPTIEGLPVDEFIRRNADPVWLFKNEMYEELYQWEEQQNQQEKQGDSQSSSGYDFKMVNCSDDDLPI
jgi:16S rRNA U516 pseudouridylate synthase RsuA-like enzyme